jgi:hypothetical protein
LQVLIDVIGLPDPPVARGEDIPVEMAFLELVEAQNFHEITLEVIEYDRTAKEMWMAMTSEIGNGTLYASAAFDEEGNLIEFGALRAFCPAVTHACYITDYAGMSVSAGSSQYHCSVNVGQARHQISLCLLCAPHFSYHNTNDTVCFAL